MTEAESCCPVVFPRIVAAVYDYFFPAGKVEANAWLGFARSIGIDAHRAPLQDTAMLTA
jgi:hypothetical protein